MCQCVIACVGFPCPIPHASSMSAAPLSAHQKQYAGGGLLTAQSCRVEVPILVVFVWLCLCSGETMCKQYHSCVLVASPMMQNRQLWRVGDGSTKAFVRKCAQSVRTISSTLPACRTLHTSVHPDTTTFENVIIFAFGLLEFMYTSGVPRSERWRAHAKCVCVLCPKT